MPPKPIDIPSTPDAIKQYKDDWIDWEDFLGCEIRGAKIPYKKAKKIARSLGLKKRDEWYEYIKGNRPDLTVRPRGIPRDPEGAYRRSGDWEGWPEFLGFPKKGGRRPNIVLILLYEYG